MRCLLLSAALTAAAIGAIPARSSAQDTAAPTDLRRVDLAVAAGVSTLRSGSGGGPDFAAGPYLQGQLALRPTPRVGLRADALWARHPARQEDGEARVLGAALSATYQFRPAAATGPYLLAGAGVYRRRVQRDVRRTGTAVPTVARATDWAPSVGAGVRFSLAGRPAFVELRQHWLGAADGALGSLVPLAFGFRF